MPRPLPSAYQPGDRRVGVDPLPPEQAAHPLASRYLAYAKGMRFPKTFAEWLEYNLKPAALTEAQRLQTLIDEPGCRTPSHRTIWSKRRDEVGGYRADRQTALIGPDDLLWLKGRRA